MVAKFEFYTIFEINLIQFWIRQIVQVLDRINLFVGRKEETYTVCLEF